MAVGVSSGDFWEDLGVLGWCVLGGGYVTPGFYPVPSSHSSTPSKFDCPIGLQSVNLSSSSVQF